MFGLSISSSIPAVVCLSGAFSGAGSAQRCTGLCAVAGLAPTGLHHTAGTRDPQHSLSHPQTGLQFGQAL